MRLSSKKIAAAIVLAGVVFIVVAGSALAAPPWSDAPNAWWISTYGVTATEVATVADGYPDGTFKPANLGDPGPIRQNGGQRLRPGYCRPRNSHLQGRGQGQHVLHLCGGRLR